MKTIRKNRKEDLKLLIDLGENYHGEDVTFTFSAGRYGVEKYVCSYIRGEAVNLVVTGTAMMCLLDNHRLPLGTLSVEIDIRVPDPQMPDGDFRHVTRKAAVFAIGGEQCTVELTNGASDYFPEELVPEAVINLLPTVIKGDPGQDADIEGCNQAIAAMVALTEEVEMSESKRAEAEQQRMDSEAERTAAENERKAAEKERAEAETQRTEAETLREEAENTRIQNESERQTAEQERIDNFDKCVTATNTAISAAEKAVTAANNAMEKAATAEATIAKSEKAASDAAAAVETANTSLSAAEEAVTAANNAIQEAAAAEALREEAENTRTANETARQQNESERTKAETARQTAETLRVSNEKKRTESDTERTEAEKARAAAEVSRANAEKQRAEAEKQRIVNENERKEAEAARAAAEALRANNETARSNAETQRAEAERQRAAAEAARQTAESRRDEAETLRQQSETARAQAETQRAAAETERTEAENTRKQNESERQTAEQERIVNNEKCVTATNTALSAAQKATTAANNAMEVAATAEATIAKSEKAASDAAAAVETANTALTAAQKATTAANNATTDATNAAGEANAAAVRANEAADLVYNGPDENVSVACYTNVEGASTAGLVLNVYINENTVPQQYTTDENGLTAFKVTKGLRYDIVFPDIEGCSPIGRMSFTAALQTRGIEVTYQPLQKTQQEHVTISFRRYEENATWQGGTAYPDGVAHVTIDGVETTYHADSNGMADFFVDLGKEYTVQIEKPADLHLVNGVYNATYTADRSARVIAISFHAYLSDFLIVDANGSEWTYDGFVNSGKDPSEAILIHVATEELLAAGCDYYLSLHVLAYGKYHGTTTAIPTKSWAGQNVQFTSVPVNPSVSDPLYYDGYKSTYLIINEGLDRGIATDCHTFTTRETIQLGLDTLYGYTPTKGQYEPLIANYNYFNNMVLYARPDGNPVTNFWNKSKGTSTQQSATVAYRVIKYVATEVKRDSFYSPFPAYAKTSL